MLPSSTPTTTTGMDLLEAKGRSTRNASKHALNTPHSRPIFEKKDDKRDEKKEREREKEKDKGKDRDKDTKKILTRKCGVPLARFSTFKC